MKVYIVRSVCGDYEDRREYIVGVFAKRKDADALRREMDSEQLIDQTGYDNYEDAVYNIVPREIFNSWPYTESEDGEAIYAKKYNGYSLKEFQAQKEREDLAYEKWLPSRIETFEVQ